MKLLVSGSVAQLNNLSKIIKAFRGVSSEVIKEEGDEVPSPPVVATPVDTNTGESTEGESKTDEGASTEASDTNAEGTESKDSKADEADTKGKNKSKKSSK